MINTELLFLFFIFLLFVALIDQAYKEYKKNQEEKEFERLEKKKAKIKAKEMKKMFEETTIKTGRGETKLKLKEYACPFCGATIDILKATDGAVLCEHCNQTITLES